MILRAGDRFGRYQIVRKLGEGGMAIVYEASSPFGVPVVLKVLNPEMIIEPDVVERFRREGRIQYTLRHPNIVRVTDIAEENGIPALVIDYLRGEDLEQALMRGRRFSLAEVVGMAVKLLDALDTAHEHGFVHRDLKPSNIFLEAMEHGDYEPRLMDFGIAKIQEAAALTRAQSFCGTPAYSSPEQVESTRDVDARADIFSFGVVMWELLSGQQPWRQYADDPYRVLLAVVREQLPELPKNVPEVFREIVSKAMQPEPSRRFATAREFRQALISASASHAELANTVVGSSPGRAAAPAAAAKGPTTPPQSARNPELEVPELRQPAPAKPNPDNELAAAARAARTAMGHAGNASAALPAQAASAAVGGSTMVPGGSAVPAFGSVSNSVPATATAPSAGSATDVPPVGPTHTFSLPEGTGYDPNAEGASPAYASPVTMVPDGFAPPPRLIDGFQGAAGFVAELQEELNAQNQENAQRVSPAPIEDRDSLLDRAIEAARTYGLLVFSAVVFVGLLVVAVDLLWNRVPLPDDFVVLEPASFVMGSPVSEPGRRSDEHLHPVTLTYRFAVQNHEVTRGEYGELMPNVPDDFAACGDDCPVMNVSWTDAAMYANAKSMREGLDNCYRISSDNGARQVSWPEGLRCEGYRLPTEAEWELAARAGVSESTWAGNITTTGRSPLDPALGNIAIYGGNSAVTWNPAESCTNWNTGAERCGPRAIRSLSPNPNGLYDVIGNASEWVWDNYAPLPTAPETDPVGPDQGSSRVVRGCSYRDTAELCRVAAREGMAAIGRRTIGFRLVRTMP
jgi:serine/threonine protein kinase/formylglycine-generating enzyme required for sulfatase activity